MDFQSGKAPILDAEVLADLSRLDFTGKRNVAQELVQIFLDTSRTQISQMEEALTSIDDKSFYVAAHTLKSSSAHLGAIRLRDLCEHLEQAKPSTGLLQAESIFSLAKAVWRETARQLDSFQKSKWS